MFYKLLAQSQAEIAHGRDTVDTRENAAFKDLGGNGTEPRMALKPSLKLRTARPHKIEHFFSPVDQFFRLKEKEARSLRFSRLSEPCTAVASMLEAKSARRVQARLFLGSVAHHKLRVTSDGVFTLQSKHNHRTGDHKSHEIFEKIALG